MGQNKETLMRRTVIVWLGAMICCALWGSAFPCIKLGYGMFHIPAEAVGSQILFAGYRFTLAGILVILMGSALNRRLLLPKKESFGKIIKLSFFQTIAQYLLFYIGLAHTTGVKASIIEGVNVFLAILIASLLYKQEKLNTLKMAGCIVGFAGVVLANVTRNGLDMNMSLPGEGFIFLSATAYAFSSVYLKKYSKYENPMILSGYQFIAGGIVMIVCGLAAGGRVSGFTLPNTMMLVYLAFVSAVAYSLWGILLKYNPVSKVAVFGFMNLVFGVLLSALLLGELTSIGWKSIVALVLVCAGIYIVNQVKTEENHCL